MSEKIFSQPYIRHMANKRFEGEEQVQVEVPLHGPA